MLRSPSSEGRLTPTEPQRWGGEREVSFLLLARRRQGCLGRGAEVTLISLEGWRGLQRLEPRARVHSHLLGWVHLSALA